MNNIAIATFTISSLPTSDSHSILYCKREKMEMVSPEQHPNKAFAWAATDSSGVLSPFKISRRLLYILYLLHPVIYFTCRVLFTIGIPVFIWFLQKLKQNIIFNSYKLHASFCSWYNLSFQ